MNTKRILVSVVTGALLTGSLMAASGNDQTRTRTKVRASKPTATTTVSSNQTNRTVRTNRAVRTQRAVTNSGNPRYITGTTSAPAQTRTRVVTRSSSYPYRSYSYGYGGGYYGGGYPYYGYNYGPSISFGFGSPYYGGYYPYDYYGYNYPYNYRYGAYSYNDYGHGSIVIAVQTRLARMGYYRGPIDGIMGPGTSFAIRAYERDHGLRMDGGINGPLIRSMGLRY
jgi:hypothetical protein